MADRLESWKQIAGHLGRDVRTVQRWEKREGLPVHRHAQDSISSVYANTSELDAWWGQRGGQVENPAVPQARPNYRYVWIGALAVAAAVGGWAVYRPSRVPEVARTRPLTTYPGREFDPTFSPDGSQVAFSWNRGEDNFDIYVKSLDAAEPHRLTRDPAEDYYPAWSPSGQWIAFVRALGSDRAGIFLVPPTGGAERKVGEVAFPDSRVKRMPVAWSADEQYLFVSDRESSGERLALFVLNLATSEKRRLTNPPAESYGDTDAAQAPDGRSLAFVRSRGFAGTLVVLPLREGLIANGEPKAIFPAMEPLGSTAWTPDGTAIVFHSGLVESQHLWRVAVSGKSRPEALAVSGGDVSEPALSRDGRQLVYVKQSLDTNIWRLSVAQPGGSPKGMSRVIDSTAMDFSPHLSADGRKVAFVSMRSGAYGIWISEADGSRPAQITSLMGAMTGSPHWSPDGNELAFDSAASGRSQIYLVSAAGGLARRIESRYHDCAPSFSHDGRFLYFGSDRNGSFQVWRRPRNGGEPVPVTRGGGHGALDSPDGRYLYYTKEHRMVSCSLWRVALDGGEESQVVDLVASRAFAVGNTGIYYIAQSGHLPALRWRSHDGRQDRLVLQMDKALGGTGIAVSPDEKEVLFTVVDHIESDLMLWEHFR